MIQRIITYSFYLLFALTPILWFSWNFELFEYNKMMFVYLITIIIAAAWLLKMVKEEVVILKRTPLDIPILIFLAANILSTIFSIDPHISIFGYYSRLNGGLLSTISYIILYYALVSNFKASDVLNFLKAAVFGGVIVSLYAIPEHFGASPSCLILLGQFSDGCWVQDVQARVFATLGQPNWLAAYLAMLIFPAIYFLLTSTKKIPLILNSLYIILFYLAFTFTYSRGATLGLIAGVVVFALGLLKFKLSHLRNISYLSILGAIIFINLLFGSALTDFKLLNKFAAPSREAITLVQSSGTQLETGGTESGAIRLIVWHGAIDIFKHYPLFGSGVETFAYSYYLYRPAEHNLVSEWDFLYNKAHNEFLNYLATTGLIGFLSYMFLIISFVIFCIRYYVLSIKDKEPKTVRSQALLIIHNTQYLILISLLASYISYLVQNFFGFSVVIIAMFFFLFPALVFTLTDNSKPLKELKLPKLLNKSPKIFQAVILITAGLLIYKLANFYLADTYFAKGIRASEAGNPGKAYNQLTQAVNLNPGEPYYKSELGFAAASAALALREEDSSTSAELKDQAVDLTKNVLQSYPNNVSYFRTAIRTYYMLSGLDKNYNQTTLDTLDKTIKLAPTDVKLLYNKGVILSRMDKKEEAILNFKKAIELKQNYQEAKDALKQIEQQ